MNKLLNKGKVLISFVSVLAILAVSVLSVFSGGFLAVFAEEDATETETAPKYPLNDVYDADYTEVTTPGIWYESVDFTKKTETSKFTGFDYTFCFNEDTEGDGTANNPYIIKTANQFAAVVTGNLKDKEGNWISTEGVSFKIADNVYGFDLNNTGSTVDFSKDTLTAAEVEAELKDAAIVLKDKNDKEIAWTNLSNKPFMGRFDGNGACVYGLKGSATYTAIFPKIGGNITVKNLTVKNCYFEGQNVSALFGANLNPEQTTSLNTKHFLYNCQVYNNVLVCTFATNEAIQKCGILIGQTSGKGAGLSTESNLVVNDCLVYGNVAKHAQNDDNIPNNRNIKYGLVGNLHRSGSLMISNSIVMDAAPHALYYGSNAHLTSTYKNLYTNGIGYEWENFDITSNTTVDGFDYANAVTTKYVYKYTVDDSNTPRVEFDHYDKTGKNLTNSGKGYDKVLTGSTIFVKEGNDIKSADSLEGIDTERWTYNKGTYPTPKIYKLREYSAGTNWSGEQAVQFGEGDGSKSAPYTIATAEELVLMLTQPVTGAYYKLVANISINDTSAENWTENAKTWFTSNDVPTFEASLDGNGYTVSGLYYDGTQAGEYVGLIPVVGNTAEIRKITIADSVIKANKGAAGGIAGMVADRCTKVVKFDACEIKGDVKFEGEATFAGMVGQLGYSVTKITNCISESKGLFNNVTGTAKVEQSVSIGAYPCANPFSVEAENVYTDTAVAAEKAADGVIVLTNDEMKGAAAESNMTGLDFSTTWETTDLYPQPTGAAASAEGVKGEVWSGAIATEYAGGEGTKEKPYLIETPEQLAKLVSTSHRPKPKENDFKVGEDVATKSAEWTKEELRQWNLSKIEYYKITADIYVNEVTSKLWEEKIGCQDWFSQWVNGTYTTISHINLDGDGHVIYGLFYDHTQGATEYVRVGLFPVLCEYSTVENLGLSNVHFVGMNVDNKDPKHLTDSMGAFVGCSEDYDKDDGLDSHDAAANYEIMAQPEYEEKAVKIKSCFVDHHSYISAYFTGGFFGSPYGGPIIENSIFTGSLGGHETDSYYTSVFTGCDSTYATQLRGCIAFPTTDYVQLVAGSNGASWRSNPNYYVTIADPVYYFNLKQQFGATYTKLTKPFDRFGDAAKEAMPLLDWAGDSKDGTNDYWTAIEGGTPVPTIFTKHHTVEEILGVKNPILGFSCTKFETPKVTVAFTTGTSEITVEEITGEMYSKDGFVLPELERNGYKFTGWYVFSDCSIKYPYDYFPPRDHVLYAGWEKMGVTQDFEQYPDTIWDYDEEYWLLNKPGSKGYNNQCVRNGSKSMHLLGNKPESADFLLNYEEMLVPGTAYTLSFWVTTDKEKNPPTLISLVHNDYPDYLDTATAIENVAVVTGLKVGEWTQYSYSFTARTQWASIRATGNSSLYFDDIVMASLDGVLSDGKVIVLGNGKSPSTADGVSVAVLVSALMACAAVAVISRKNLVEIIED